MSSKSSIVTDTRSPEYVAWTAAIWKANDLRNQFEAQLKICEQLRPKDC
jgi:hypothetical protein